MQLLSCAFSSLTLSTANVSLNVPEQAAEVITEIPEMVLVAYCKFCGAVSQQGSGSGALAGGSTSYNKSMKSLV